MKPPKSRHSHDTLQTALRSAFPIDARRLVVLSTLILAVIQARTVVPDYPSKRGMSVLKVRQDAPDGCSRRSWR